MCQMVLACLMFGYLAPVFWMFIEGVYLHYNKASYYAGVDVPDGAGLPDVRIPGLVFWMFIEGVYLHYNKVSYCAGVDVPDGAGLHDVRVPGPPSSGCS